MSQLSGTIPNLFTFPFLPPTPQFPEALQLETITDAEQLRQRAANFVDEGIARLGGDAGNILGRINARIETRLSGLESSATDLLGQAILYQSQAAIASGQQIPSMDEVLQRLGVEGVFPQTSAASEAAPLGGAIPPLGVSQQIPTPYGEPIEVGDGWVKVPAQTIPIPTGADVTLRGRKYGVGDSQDELRVDLEYVPPVIQQTSSTPTKSNPSDPGIYTRRDSIYIIPPIFVVNAAGVSREIKPTIVRISMPAKPGGGFWFADSYQPFPLGSYGTGGNNLIVPEIDTRNYTNPFPIVIPPVFVGVPGVKWEFYGEDHGYGIGVYGEFHRHKVSTGDIHFWYSVDGQENTIEIKGVSATYPERTQEIRLGWQGGRLSENRTIIRPFTLYADGQPIASTPTIDLPVPSSRPGTSQEIAGSDRLLTINPQNVPTTQPVVFGVPVYLLNGETPHVGLDFSGTTIEQPQPPPQPSQPSPTPPASVTQTQAKQSSQSAGVGAGGQCEDYWLTYNDAGHRWECVGGTPSQDYPGTYYCCFADPAQCQEWADYYNNGGTANLDCTTGPPSGGPPPPPQTSVPGGYFPPIDTTPPQAPDTCPPCAADSTTGGGGNDKACTSGCGVCPPPESTWQFKKKSATSGPAPSTSPPTQSPQLCPPGYQPVQRGDSVTCEPIGKPSPQGASPTSARASNSSVLDQTKPGNGVTPPGVPTPPATPPFPGTPTIPPTPSPPGVPTIPGPGPTPGIPPSPSPCLPGGQAPDMPHTCPTCPPSPPEEDLEADVGNRWVRIQPWGKHTGMSAQYLSPCAEREIWERTAELEPIGPALAIFDSPGWPQRHLSGFTIGE